jgi:NAD(P)-dependent dehydrogenase (short-subunit alcohol dehydrogenase family)
MMSEKLFELTDRAAIVTGASSGLGQHFSLTLARAGVKVALAARRGGELAALAREIEGFDGRAVPITVDVTKADSVKAAVEIAETELGPITILVNNAGIVVTKPALRTDESDWDRVVDTDLKGAWLMAKEVASHMVRLGHGGSIINIGSILGIGAVAQVPAYSAAKAGLHQLTRALAVELARHDIRVNAIAPGYIETDLNRDFLATEAGQALLKRVPQRHAGTPRDLDGALMLLASDASRFMTGSVIVVDGGHSIAM